MTDMERFIQEGTALLEQIKFAHELSVEKEKSANGRIKFMQWIIVIFLVPMLVTSGANSNKNMKQLDIEDAYEIFSTKERIKNLSVETYFMNEEKINAASRGETINTDDKYHRILQQFIGDTSRGGN